MNSSQCKVYFVRYTIFLLTLSHKSRYHRSLMNTRKILYIWKMWSFPHTIQSWSISAINRTAWNMMQLSCPFTVYFCLWKMLTKWEECKRVEPAALTWFPFAPSFNIETYIYLIQCVLVVYLISMLRRNKHANMEAFSIIHTVGSLRRRMFVVIYLFLTA